MTILSEERSSFSPYIETVIRGRTACQGSTIRPAESHWHMVLSRHDGIAQFMVVGPLPSSGVVSYGGDAEILWIKFRLGVFMPHLPTRQFLNVETVLPEAASRSFWLKGSAWPFPDFENVETFIDRLVREEVLVSDPVVNAVREGQPHDWSPRTVRDRFLRAAGMTQAHIFQIERAQRAAALLQQGASILDAVYETGYFDQPHLTRALKQWVGYTPAQILRMREPACQNIQDSLRLASYDDGIDVLLEQTQANGG